MKNLMLKSRIWEKFGKLEEHFKQNRKSFFKFEKMFKNFWASFSKISNKVS